MVRVGVKVLIARMPDSHWRRLRYIVDEDANLFS